MCASIPEFIPQVIFYCPRRPKASGAAAGMGYENNTRAGLITRSLAEMTRIGVAYGGNPLTFLSLAGDCPYW